MAGRPKIFDEREAIQNATEIFRNKGYDTASAEELLNAMGIGKGSFYLAFKGGKQELYLRSIKQFAEEFNKKIAFAFENSDDHIQLIRQLFISLADADECDVEKGCYLGNALVQLSEKDKDIKKVTAGLLKNLQKIFAEAIRKAQANNQLTTKDDPEVLAWHLTNLWNGIHVTRRMDNSPEILKTMIEMNLRVLE